MRGAPRFLCDEMLGHLCRYLRAAGYDTELAENGTPDAELLRQASAEGRLFLTLDRRIVEHKAANGVAVVLPRGTLDDYVRALGHVASLDWVSRAFTRCLVDNAPLETAGPEKRREAPPALNRDGEPMSLCPACGRVYWRGSHYRRMWQRLTRWQHQKRT